MSETTLFEPPAPVEATRAPPTRPDQARVLRPERRQIRFVPVVLESLLRPDHPARAIWDVLSPDESGSAFYRSIKAVVDRPRHPPTDPRVLLAVWLLATPMPHRGARRLGRLSEGHDAYRPPQADAGAFPSTITCCRTSGWRIRGLWTIC